VRLFVAVNLPDSEKQTLAEILSELQELALPFRWVEPDSLHITLKFLGQVSGAQRIGLTDALAAAVAGIPPFDVGIGGFGVFPKKNKPNIIWVATTAPPQLLELQQHVETRTEPLGFPREARPFHPHITIGRAKKQGARVDSAQLDRILASLVYKSIFRVESLDLMRSHTDARGARYERIERHGLSD
jgi:RNA 2',3'-cyclic 3'-phosphodiesterase